MDMQEYISENHFFSHIFIAQLKVSGCCMVTVGTYICVVGTYICVVGTYICVVGIDLYLLFFMFLVVVISDI